MSRQSASESATYSHVRHEDEPDRRPARAVEGLLTQPTFHSSGFQIGTGVKRIGSTVPNATADHGVERHDEEDDQPEDAREARASARASGGYTSR